MTWEHDKPTDIHVERVGEIPPAFWEAVMNEKRKLEVRITELEAKVAYLTTELQQSHLKAQGILAGARLGDAYRARAPRGGKTGREQ